MVDECKQGKSEGMPGPCAGFDCVPLSPFASRFKTIFWFQLWRWRFSKIRQVCMPFSIFNGVDAILDLTKSTHWRFFSLTFVSQALRCEFPQDERFRFLHASALAWEPPGLSLPTFSFRAVGGEKTRSRILPMPRETDPCFQAK